VSRSVRGATGENAASASGKRAKTISRAAPRASMAVTEPRGASSASALSSVRGPPTRTHRPPMRDKAAATSCPQAWKPGRHRSRMWPPDGEASGCERGFRSGNRDERHSHDGPTAAGATGASPLPPTGGVPVGVMRAPWHGAPEFALVDGAAQANLWPTQWMCPPRGAPRPPNARGTAENTENARLRPATREPVPRVRQTSRRSPEPAA
jgi:hypothetical protein